MENAPECPLLSCNIEDIPPCEGAWSCGDIIVITDDFL